MKRHLYKVQQKVRDRFSEPSFTLFSLHSVEIFQTAVRHPEQWTSLHLVISLSLLGAAAKFFLQK